MSRVIAVHGWGGSPETDWFPWLNRILKAKGYDILIPKMPDTEHPKIVPWVNKIERTVGKIQTDDVLIGHSIGCQAILRFMEKVDSTRRIHKVILIAPWNYLILDVDEEQEDADPWLNTPIDLEKVKNKAKKIVAIFSRNDPYVPLNKNVEYFKKISNIEVVTKENSGHFTTGDGFKELPFILDYLN